ncbi:hypothetical protein [Hydrogenimonas sp.]
MVKKGLLVWLLALAAFGDNIVMDRVRTLMDEETFAAHKKLIDLLFEDQNSYMRSSSVDMVKVATTLEENGLLNLALPSARQIELIFEYGGENPLFFMKLMTDTLRNMGLSFILTKEARLEKEGFVWRVTFESKTVPDPVLLAKRLEKNRAVVTDLERLDAAEWRYRIEMDGAVVDAKPIRAGESLKIVRPIRPVWMEVGAIKRLIIRELPGSHWYADVVVYDKMLRILSMKQNETRTRYLNLRLPADAAYVKIGDRFTLENLRSGLKLTAKGEK